MFATQDREQFGGAADDLLRTDPAQASDEMLLGVLLIGATGSRKPGDVARDLIVATRGALDQVGRSDIVDEVRGMGPLGRAKLAAAAELFRRISYRSHVQANEKISTASDAVNFLRTMALGPDEKLVALYLNNRRNVVHSRVIHVGSPQFTVVDGKSLFRPAIEHGAQAIIMAHNHPSGDPTPSSQDRDVTNRIASQGRILGIPLLDHLVVGGGYRWTSLAEEGSLPRWADTGTSWIAER